MSLLIPFDVMECLAQKPDSRIFLGSRHYADKSDYQIKRDDVTKDSLEMYLAAANEVGSKKLIRAIDAVLRAISGENDVQVPNFLCAQYLMEHYLAQNAIRGWIFRKNGDGYSYPEVVTHIQGFKSDYRLGKEGNPPFFEIHTVFFGSDGVRYKSKTGSYRFQPSSVINKKPSRILEASHIFHETEKLIADYMAEMEYFDNTVRDGFAEQYFFSGHPERTEYSRTSVPQESPRAVIHDVPSSEYNIGRDQHVESSILEGFSKKTDGQTTVPMHPLVHIFDLKSHRYSWTNASNLTPYIYDESLRDKMVLPESHRDLLDILTTDLDAFIDDMIRGKSAGNIILCKGGPGLGKTLTAEVYSELIHRPLLSINAGSLGIEVNRIKDNLDAFFSKSKRWRCVLLLDEADVFVAARGSNIQNNAIVAEFLRMLEYFDGLLFMTTNRPDDIDEAILSRCAAIIHYQAPVKSDAIKIWNVMAAQYQTTLPPNLVKELVEKFDGLAARDIKNLLRLTLRVAKGRDEPLTYELFRRCSMFRGIQEKTPQKEASV